MAGKSQLQRINSIPGNGKSVYCINYVAVIVIAMTKTGISFCGILLPAVEAVDCIEKQL